MSSSMTYIKHLSELRKRLTKVLLLFIILFIAGFFIAEPVVRLFKEDLTATQLNWYVFHLTDAIRVYLQIAFVFALFMSIPFMVYQLWAFISPGLNSMERKAILPFIPASILLFGMGLLFAYFILFPMVVHFLTQIAAGMEADAILGVAQYFSFMLTLLLPFGILFELPLVVMLLTKMGILHPKRLARMRRYAYMALLIIAVSITPPDMISDILVTIPLILLFEISLLLSAIVYRKQIKESPFTEEEFD